MSNLCAIVVGPVIGKVTHSTARILVEFNYDGETNCILVKEDSTTDQANPSSPFTHLSASKKRSSPGLNLTRSFKKGVPCVFQFDHLRPETSYKVTFPSCIDWESRVGKFHTLAENSENMTIITLSCNSINEPEEPVVWNDLIERYIRPDRVDLLIHMGDQVYADKAYEDGMAKLKLFKKMGSLKEAASVDLFLLKSEITEGYRDFYRATWNYPPTREVLASVSNLMLWDDHDIRNDWGTPDTDRDPESDEYFVGLCARQAYWEYQRQLWDDILDPHHPVPTMEGHFHRYGNTGVMIVDIRGSRSFYYDKNANLNFLSPQQWEAINLSLRPQGIFDGVTSLLVVLSVAVCCTGQKMAVFGAQLKALTDKMGFGLHPHEQIAFIETLHKWKTGQPNRDIVLIGGDLHMAVRTQVRYKNECIFEQLVTSPIRQHSPPGLGYNFMKSIMSTVEELRDGYSYKHTLFKGKRNFGIINVEGTVMRATHYYRRNASKKKSSPDADITLYSDGELLITDVSGKNLVGLNSNGLSDPYFKFKFDKCKVKTEHKKDTLNPTFQPLKMLFKQEDYISAKLSKEKRPILYISLRDKNQIKLDGHMGQVEIDIHKLLVNKGDFASRSETFDNIPVSMKSDKEGGTISLTLTFRPSS